ncbi:divergent PAP2 family protein [candidate division TA06 bacterium]|uniref:Divergent PAP2 family protein n=1 Tax=candidate division TA06 bacterium TaxID=2250710 RepID=A0A933I8Y4_UNCT6|nr:divergent PAP2 family protein [candidate division TA06 bacterium]
MLWAVAVSGISTQVLKAFASVIWEGRLNWRRTLEPGGMPSSHAASSATMATMIGLSSGFDSWLFALSCYAAFVVMYDAAGVRRAVGRQAMVLNQMLGSRNLKKRAQGLQIKELLGHTPIEVVAGCILGIFWGLVFHYLIG